MQETQIWFLVGKIPQRRKWPPVLVFFLTGKLMDRGVGWTTVHEVTNSWILLRTRAHTKNYRKKSKPIWERVKGEDSTWAHLIKLLPKSQVALKVGICPFEQKTDTSILHLILNQSFVKEKMYILRAYNYCIRSIVMLFASNL